MDKPERKVTATVSGSFKKHLNRINETILEFKKNGIEVLSPQLSRPISRESDFVILESDKGNLKEIESKHLEAISQSDFLYVVNPRGYIGKSSALEIGFALSRNVPVYSLQKPIDPVFSSFVISKSLPTIKRSIASVQDKIRSNEKSLTLAELQSQVRHLVKTHGFEEETVEDVLLLLVEEIGELARATRKLLGLKVSQDFKNSRENFRQELADCLIYLTDIANLTNTDLEHAFREKHELDFARKWH